MANGTGSDKKSDLYLICNSLPIDSVTEGVGRYEDIRNDNDSIYDHRPISFLMVSRSKDIRIWFDHYCFNTNERRKIVAIDRTDQLKIIYKPRSFLKTIEQAKPIRLEDRLDFEINEEAWLGRKRWPEKYCTYSTGTTRSIRPKMATARQSS